MKKWTLLFGLVVGLQFLASAQTAPANTANYRLAARFSPENLGRMVFSTRVDPHWLKNSDRFWYTYETSDGLFYYLVDPAKAEKKLLFDRDDLAAQMSRLTGDPFDGKHLNISNLRFLEDENAIQYEVKSKLVEEDEEEEQEEEGKGQDDDKRKNKKKGKKEKKSWHFKYALNTANLVLLDGYKKPKDDAKWATVSPDSSFVLFARQYNLYWMDSANYAKALEDEQDSTIVEHQWTKDGQEYYSYDSGQRGQTNSEKEENKDKRQSVSVLWGPDGRTFAMTRYDSRHLKELYVVNSVAEPRPTLEVYKYQMPGEKESAIPELWVFDYDEQSEVAITTERFPDQTISLLREPMPKSTRDDIRRYGYWLGKEKNKIYFARTSRDLKRIDVCKADIASGEVEGLVEERLNTYIDFAAPALVNGGKELVHWSERDGWAHLYLYDNRGNLKNQITKGSWHVAGIEGVDERKRQVYFRANGREPGEDPYYEHLYRINLDGSGLQLLNPGNYDHSISLNDKNTYFVSNHSRVDTTPQSVLYDSRGGKSLDLETADLSQLFEAGYRFPEPFKAKAGDGVTDIYGVIYKPFDFDSTRSYPLIEYVYPGPQTEAVSKAFSYSMDRTDRMAQLGFVVITLGNRGGHPARSKWYHNYGYGNLRDYGLEDKKVVAEQLAFRHSFIDISKVGIFGHSGGAFMTTAALLVYPDFFKVGIASSGNHDNAVYNRWWSEKHHGVKEETDAEGNVSFVYSIEKNPELAKNLKGRLLLTTGDIDNNVHPAGTIRMANALIKANKRFDFFNFPGQRHGYGDMNEYFFWMRADYFSRYLMGDPSERPIDLLYMNDVRPQNR